MTTGVLKMNSGVYRCPDSIKNFKMSVKLKKLHSMANSDEDIDLNLSEKEMKTFSWQEKVFSRSEAEFYAKKSNCVTEREKQYHEMISDNIDVDNFGRLFTYVEGDNFNNNEESVTTEVNRKMTALHKEMSNLRIGKKVKVTSKSISSGYEINKFLNNSISNPFTANSYETMYVMADLGDSEPNSNVWLKSEHVLCRIKYDENNKLLWMYPDFSANKNDTYMLEIDVGGKLYYEYSIENISDTKKIDIVEQENDIIKKINRRNHEMKTQLLSHEFLVPEKDTFRFCILFEILTGKHFEYDNVYVQYNIDLPENWSTVEESSLFGTTQSCRTKGIDNLANFGHYFDVCLEYKKPDLFEGVIPPPTIYFQVISHDVWDRFRTEGLAYRTIPVQEPGKHEYSLQCMRICPSGATGQLRRFFIGDAYNVEDMTWLRIPKNHQGSTLNKYGVPTIGTGILSVRVNILQQTNCKTPRTPGDGVSYEEGVPGSSNVMRGVAEALIAFRRARDRMLQARNSVLQQQ